MLGAAALTTIAIAPAFATHDATATADSSASTGQGPLFELLDTGACTATDTATTTSGNPPKGRCGDGLSLNAQINAFDQNASAPGDGTSAADASVAPIDIADFTSLDLTGILDGVTAIDTGTVLDDVIQGVDPLLQPVLDALVPTLVGPLDDALQDVLTQVGSQLPVSIEIGAIESHCTATAEPLRAEGNSTVAGIDIILELGDQVIRVPITIGSGPNTPLLVSVPDIVAGLTQGLQDTLTESLGGALGPLADVIATLDDQVISTLMEQLTPVLEQLGTALEPLIKGTVNKQEPVSPSSTGEIEVTGLELILADGAIGELDLARSHCGKNTDGTPHTPPPTTETPSPSPSPSPTDPGIPTQVDSGLEGDSGQGTAILVGTGALMLVAGVTGLAAYRRMLQQ